MGRELNRWPVPDCPVEEGKKEQNNLLVPPGQKFLHELWICQLTLQTWTRTNWQASGQSQPAEPPCPSPAVANPCCFSLTASKYSQNECEQLCLEVNSFLAPASNCLKPWDRRFDYNHGLHMFGACLGKDRLSSPLLPVKGGWDAVESHGPQSWRGPQRLTIAGFLFPR